jgi:hypothetical protein
VKKDATIAIIAIVLIGALSFGLNSMRPPFQPRRSEPFSTAPVGPTIAKGTVVMRVNGEPVTENEFEAAFAQMPDEMKQQFASEPGKQAFAEQYIRIKLLEQEARKMGIDKDPKVEGMVSANRTTIVGNAAADKLVGQPTKQAVQTFYDQNANKFEQLDLSHIVIAYAGGSIPPRNGGKPPTETEAANLALKIWQQVHNGADFGEMARKYSDDVSSVSQDGRIGPISHGMLPPELDSRIWRIPVGQISDPIPSRFGIHLFKVNARKAATLQQVSAAITRHVKQQNTMDRIEVLRKNAKVEFDPKFFPDAKTWPSNNPNPPAQKNRG